MRIQPPESDLSFLVHCRHEKMLSTPLLIHNLLLPIYSTEPVFPFAYSCAKANGRIQSPPGIA